MEFGRSVCRWVSGWTFSYVRPVLRVGYRTPLEQEHVPSIAGTADDPRRTVLPVLRHLEERKSFWAVQERAGMMEDAPESEGIVGKVRVWYGASGAAVRMWAIFLLAYWPHLILPAICKLFGDLLGFVPPLCLNLLLLSLHEEEGDSELSPVAGDWSLVRYFEWSNAYLYALGIFVAFCCQSLLLHQHHNIVIRVGMWARSAIGVLVYNKCLTLSVGARGRIGQGKINSLVSSDAAIVEHTFWVGNYLWAAPLQIVIAFALLFREVQWSVFAGVAVMVAIVVGQTLMGRLQGSLRKRKAKLTDERVELTTECVSGIRILKLYAWEFLFGQQILDVREKELQVLRRIAGWRALNNSILTAGTTLVTLAAFTCYGLLQDTLESDPLTPAKAFTSLALFNLLRLPLMTLPDIVVTIFNSFVSMQRLQEVLLAEEAAGLPLSGKDVTVMEMERVDEEPIVVDITDGVFSWEDDSKAEGDSQADADADALLCQGYEEGDGKWHLRVPSLKVPQGHLVMIVGGVGSGKSSLLESILRETHMEQGSVAVHSASLAYCTQQPWILNATVRENILFGLPMQREFYEEVVFACALQSDMLNFPHGDSTEIGEKGVNLSGGQKARIGLARAVYARCDLLLLDDIFAAVDVHVGEHILRHCLKGLLEGTTRLLVTHSRSILAEADLVVRMATVTTASGAREATIRSQGRYSDVADDLPDDEVGDTPEEEEGKREGEEVEGETETETEEEQTTTAADGVVPAFTKALESVGELMETSFGGEDEEEDPTLAEEADGRGARLTDDEDRERGVVRLAVLGRWLSALPLPLSLAMVAVLFVQAALSLVMYWWLSAWSIDQFGRGVMYYVAIYAAISLGVVGLILAYQVMMAVAGIRASRALHRQMLHCILRAPVSFFDKTPMGRLVNRFTADFYVVDEQLVSQLGGTLSRIAAVGATLTLIVFLVPWLVIILLPCMLLYIKIQHYYSASSRELRRLDKVSRSPVFNALAEVLEGSTSIRAYQCEERFSEKNAAAIEENLRPFWFSHQINRWLGIRLEVIGAFISTAVAVAGVFFRHSLGGGYVGLMISQSLAMSSSLNWTIRSFVELETQLTSVERIGHYTGGIAQEFTEEEMREAVEEEKQMAAKDSTVAERQWPTSGRVEFRDVVLRYREDLPPALDGISFVIADGEKVGVCGRTGAGKSSLIQALFRLVEPCSGAVLVDGVDASSLPLHVLRSAVTVIPQEPLLFTGSIRRNLDPLGSHNDVQLWQALEEVELKAMVTSLGEGLDSQVKEGGRNFSVGQRQLLCIARATLRNTKIVVLDEATAAVDAETDALVQRMLRKVFAKSTTLTIAHRIHTIADSDTILVLAGGAVAEAGAPADLLARPAADSAFRRLMEASSMPNGG